MIIHVLCEQAATGVSIVGIFELLREIWDVKHAGWSFLIRLFHDSEREEEIGRDE